MKVKKDEKAALVACPTCHSPPGNWCLTREGAWTQKLHASRIRSYEQYQETTAKKASRAAGEA